MTETTKLPSDSVSATGKTFEMSLWIEAMPWREAPSNGRLNWKIGRHLLSRPLAPRQQLVCHVKYPVISSWYWGYWRKKTREKTMRKVAWEWLRIQWKWTAGQKIPAKFWGFSTKIKFSGMTPSWITRRPRWLSERRPTRIHGDRLGHKWRRLQNTPSRECRRCHQCPKLCVSAATRRTTTTSSIHCFQECWRTTKTLGDEFIKVWCCWTISSRTEARGSSRRHGTKCSSFADLRVTSTPTRRGKTRASTVSVPNYQPCPKPAIFPVRHRVKLILDMLNDDDKLSAERSKATSDDKSKYRGYDQYDIKMSSSSSSSSNYNKKWESSSSSNNFGDTKRDNREVSNFSFSSNSNANNRSPSPELGFVDEGKKGVEEDDGFGDFVSSRSSQPAATNKSTPNPTKPTSFFDSVPAIPPPSATSNYVAPPLSPSKILLLKICGLLKKLARTFAHCFLNFFFENCCVPCSETFKNNLLNF